jgi:hypothetical protein
LLGQPGFGGGWLPIGQRTDALLLFTSAQSRHPPRDLQCLRF